jgi:hypothetical protein
MTKIIQKDIDEGAWQDLDDMTREQLLGQIMYLRKQIEQVNEHRDWYRDRVVWGFYEDEVPHYIQGRDGEHEINEPVTAEQIRKAYKALELYERERARFRHAHPEITGAYFLAGGHGVKDQNMLPQFVEICPAYGAGWVKIYEDTGRTISYEGD